jgi:dTDP-4-amino-4,6-dideoxygalactose transaminase
MTQQPAPLLEPIPFNRPSLTGREMQYVRDAVARGHIAGNGWYTRQCEELLGQILGGSRVLLTTSCTHALEMAALLLDVGPGDEVIVPSFTFVSTASAFALRGARPVFVDIQPDTLNIDAERIAAAITAKTRAAVIVHYGGVACDMEAIGTVVKGRIALIEDAAHALFGSYRQRPLATLGSLATLSFHETKNVSCGEGGALVLNDASFVPRAEIIREKGTDRSSFFRGEVDKYTWRGLGSSYVPSDLLAAYLLAQLESRDAIQNARRAIWERYDRELRAWADDRGVRLLRIPPGTASAYHLFSVVMESAEARDALIAHLRKCNVQAVFHYVPLHLSEMGQRFGGRAGDCPVTESVSNRLVRLPFFTALPPGDQARVIDAVCSF